MSSAGAQKLVACDPTLRCDELVVVAVTRRIGSDVVLAVATARHRGNAVRPAEEPGRVDCVVEPARERLRSVDAHGRGALERLLDAGWEVEEVLLALLRSLESERIRIGYDSETRRTVVRLGLEVVVAVSIVSVCVRFSRKLVMHA